jgi:NADH-quinone oxidoreductase subunit N
MYIYTFKDLLLIVPEAFLLLSILILLVFGTVASTSRNFDILPTVFTEMANLSAAVLYLTLALLLTLNSEHFIFNGIYSITFFTQIVKIILVILTIVCIHTSRNYFLGIKVDRFEVYILMLLNVLAGMLLISSNDFLLFFIALETLSLTLYILASIKMDNEFALSAAIKYFIIGSFSSGIMCYGISLVCGLTGVYSFSELQLYFLCPLETLEPLVLNYSVFGTVLIIAGFLFKLALVPFHLWIPDVYEGAPLPITFFFATVPKTAVFFMFTKLLKTALLSIFTTFLSPVFMFIGFLTILIGTASTFSQVKVKRFLALSSVSHMGYIFISLSLANGNSFLFAFYYFLLYLALSTPLWIATLQISTYEHTFDTIPSLSALKSLKTGYLHVYSILLFSLGGIPPLMGFFSKYLIYLHLIQSNNFILAFLIGLVSVFACFLYIRILKTIFSDKSQVNPELKVKPGSSTTFLNKIILVSFLSLHLLFIYYFDIVSIFIQSFTLSL